MHSEYAQKTALILNHTPHGELPLDLMYICYAVAQGCPYKFWHGELYRGGDQGPMGEDLRVIHEKTDLGQLGNLCQKFLN